MFVPMSVKRSRRPAPAIPVTPSGGPALPSAPSRICLDFVDVGSVMRDGGRAVVSIGEATGEGRATKAAEARQGHPSTGISPSPITPQYPPLRNEGRATMIVALPSAILIGQPGPDDAARGQATTAVRLVCLGRAAALTSSRLATTRRLRMSTASDPTLATRSLSSRASATVFS
jgi:hypothetical protein